MRTFVLTASLLLATLSTNGASGQANEIVAEVVDCSDDGVEANCLLNVAAGHAGIILLNPSNLGINSDAASRARHFCTGNAGPDGPNQCGKSYNEWTRDTALEIGWCTAACSGGATSGRIELYHQNSFGSGNPTHWCMFVVSGAADGSCPAYFNNGEEINGGWYYETLSGAYRVEASGTVV